MANNREIAESVLKSVGGAENVTNVTHCMTRLRLNLKDESIPKDDEVKAIEGVLGVVRSGGQYQVVIGQNVPKVYAEVCDIGGFTTKKAVEENLDAPKEKLTPKKVFNNILNYMAGSLTPLIPVIVAAAMFKTVLAIIGPDMLKLVNEQNDLYILLNLIYNAGFYFLPIYLGYTAAKKLGTSEVLGMFLGGILISPDLLALVNSGGKFTVYGIPASLNDYSQSVLPMILSVWVMKYVHDFFKKIIPDTLSTIFVPFLTMVVMVPVSLCALAPLGSFVGVYVGDVLLKFGNFGGFVAMAVIAALWPFLVMSGMHVVLVVTMITLIMSQGSEALIAPSAACATMATVGMALGGALRLRDKKERSLAYGYFISGILGGVTEPAIYGLGFKYKRPFIGLMIGAAVGAAYAGITQVATHTFGASNFLVVLGYAPGGTANLINGIISVVLSLVVAAIATYLLGFKKDEPAIQKQ
ncbi:MAG: PTS transporter subunit EIIC [Oscillospiraceae bacterium]|nr:PTS transporter subunit EIIC [Oscillospiraceae bacterium]